MIYLDYAAATPLAENVLTAMQPYFSEKFFNPSATYNAAKQTKAALEEARSSVAFWIGAKPAEVIFTAGGTEANNLAIHGIMEQYPDANLVVSAIEHEAILEPAKQYNCRVALVTGEGIIDLEDLVAKIDDNTVLVSVMYANNEVGTIQPIRAITEIIEKIRDGRRNSGNERPIYVHTDACQAANFLDMHTARLGVDLMTINGGKIYGPKQSGALYVASRVPLVPVIRGGGQERNLRSGTENVAACIGLATAFVHVQTKRKDESKRLMQIQEHAYALIKEKIPHATVNGSTKRRLPNNIHMTIPGEDNERLLIQLDERGILAAAGSACSASDEEPSHVLRAMNLSDEAAQSSLRFTMGRQTTMEQIDVTIDMLSQLVTTK